MQKKNIIPASVAEKLNRSEEVMLPGLNQSRPQSDNITADSSRIFRSIVRILPLLILLLHATASIAWGQGGLFPEEEQQEELAPWRFGLGGLVGLGPVIHATEMTGLPGVPSCCPGYDGGSGFGLEFGLAFELPVAEKMTAALHLLYARKSGRLEAEEEEFVITNNDSVTAVFLHAIDEDDQSLAVEGSIAYEVIRHLRVLVGIRTDLLNGGAFHQEETILSPSTIRYENGQRTRMVYDGDLPGMNPLRFSILAGLGYDLPLNRTETLLLRPQLNVWQDFSTLIDERDWTRSGIRFGLGFEYRFPITTDTTTTPFHIDPIHGDDDQGPTGS